MESVISLSPYSALTPVSYRASSLHFAIYSSNACNTTWFDGNEEVFGYDVFDVTVSSGVYTIANDLSACAVYSSTSGEIGRAHV